MRTGIPRTLLALSLLSSLVTSCSDEAAEQAPDQTSSPAPETVAASPEPGVAITDEDRAGLEALGYVDRAPADDPEERGVTTDDSGDADGLNLYGSRDKAEALLTDMAGVVVHRWATSRAESWMHVEPLADGSILAITRDVHLTKYDWDSTELWRQPMRIHHDLAVRDDGVILALIRRRTSLTHGGAPMRVLCDRVVEVSADGEVLETHDLLPLFRDSLDTARLDRIRARIAAGLPMGEVYAAGGVGDVLHTNAITILHRDIDGVAPAGSVLLSFRTISRIAIVTSDFSEVLWIWGRRELDGQHDATQLENGNILAFDNGLRRGSRSRVIEVDPTTEEVVFRYTHPDLYSRLRGGAQGLSNGNLLITESDAGRAFEVTREGEVVWEFHNPDVRGRGREAQRAVIYRLNRFPSSRFPQIETPD